jgi:hypothetical protein
MVRTALAGTELDVPVTDKAIRAAVLPRGDKRPGTGMTRPPEYEQVALWLRHQAGTAPRPARDPGTGVVTLQAPVRLSEDRAVLAPAPDPQPCCRAARAARSDPDQPGGLPGQMAALPVIRRHWRDRGPREVPGPRLSACGMEPGWAYGYRSEGAGTPAVQVAGRPGTSGSREDPL